MPITLKQFSKPWDAEAYNDSSISHELITDVYAQFGQRTRVKEGGDYMKTLSGRIISLDTTFKLTNKATVVTADKKYTKPMKGGILNVINEKNEIILHRLCQTQGAIEIEEAFQGLSKRCEILGIPEPEQAVADNCCSVRNAISHALPQTDVSLDVWHFQQRYAVVILGGKKNPYRSAVINEIVSAVLRSRATKTKPAEYYNRDEQEDNLSAVYKKWSIHGGVWSAAAPEQLGHVKKGCLSRVRSDLPADGSRIEGSHKGWNSLNRSFACGLENLHYLANDFSLRRNIRMVTNHPDRAQPFAMSTCGSHHIRLADHIARTWNRLVELEDRKLKPGEQSVYERLPELHVVDSGETFGVVPSKHMLSFGGLLDIKDESNENEIKFVDDEESVLQTLDVDLSLLLVPEPSDSLSVGPSTSTHAITIQSQSDGLTTPAATALPTETPLIIVHNALAVVPPPSLSVQSSDYIDLTRDEGASRSGESIAATISIDAVAKNKRKQGGTVAVDAVTMTKKIRIDGVHSQVAAVNAVHTFFREHRAQPRPETPSVAQQSLYGSKEEEKISTTSKIPATDVKDLCVPLPLPPSSKLTRSQLLFNTLTGVDHRALMIAGDVEFFLFMNMRKEFQWASFRMTPRGFVEATQVYNERLERANRANGHTTIKKNPRALMNKLAEVEPRILQRLATQDFKSRKTGTAGFWEQHCKAVPLGKDMDLKDPCKTRKAMVCTRCMQIMYPKPSGSPENHKRGICSDGAPVNFKAKAGDTEPLDVVPPWPQPVGIFSRGLEFHPLAFLSTIWHLYQQIAVDKSLVAENLTLEQWAFGQMWQERTRYDEEDGAIYFKLFKHLEVPTSELAGLTVIERNNDGYHWLRLDCMQDSQ
ncbi:hypothetical protein EW026_g2025 [Hermanssonia centrifuga]|uniref:Transposase n=1 Tax=Hermanssonia centrifuga TaxID=98765 RepID=A0A4S4KPI6_9APHY|nr:hypothetical protein EW026_g2025 [Hermanssonia centrifuga]